MAALVQSTAMKSLPCILCIGGLDPTGGAGIQADIETVAALGGRALALVTALTVQDSMDISAVHPVSAQIFGAQMDRLLADIRPDAVKLGLLGAPDLVLAVHELLRDFAGPVVLDPVLAAGGGFDLDGDRLGRMLVEHLVPYSTLLTPNRAEARRLGAEQDAELAAQRLLQYGAGAVLLTGADEASGSRVTNRLFTPDRAPQAFDWPRLPHRYHGSGCTLASACATRLARGDELAEATRTAQQFTIDALSRADRPGGGQWLPRRLA